MFNLPWYSWFNVLAIPLLWSLIWFGLKIEKVPRWQHQFSLLGHISFVAIIFLHWNPSVSQMMTPFTYVIATFALATAAWITIPTFYEAFRVLFRTLSLQGKAKQKTPQAPVAANVCKNDNAEPEYVDGILDIECDECSNEETAQMVDAFVSAISPSKSVADTELMQQLKEGYADDELLENPVESNSTMWLTAAGTLLLVIGPIWMSVELFKGLLAGQ